MERGRDLGITVNVAPFDLVAFRTAMNVKLTFKHVLALQLSVALIVIRVPMLVSVESQNDVLGTIRVAEKKDDRKVENIQRVMPQGDTEMTSVGALDRNVAALVSLACLRWQQPPSRAPPRVERLHLNEQPRDFFIRQDSPHGRNLRGYRHFV
jgi:hypothetical protein